MIKMLIKYLLCAVSAMFPVNIHHEKGQRCNYFLPFLITSFRYFFLILFIRNSTLFLPRWKTGFGHEERRETVLFGTRSMMLRRLRRLLSTCSGDVSCWRIIINGGILVVMTCVVVVVNAPIVSFSVRCPFFFSHFVLVSVSIFPDCSFFWSSFVRLKIFQKLNFLNHLNLQLILNDSEPFSFGSTKC
jgi:hypothetical protein